MGCSSRQQPGRQIEGSKAVLDGAREFQLEFPKSLASQADEGDVVFLCNPGDLPINKDLLELALADGVQSLTFENFGRMMNAIRNVASAVDRPLRQPILA